MNYEICDLEILILTAIPKDAQLTLGVMEKSGLTGQVITSVEKICERVETAGIVILSEEVMTIENLSKLKNSLLNQPVWSDIPIILVASGSGSSFDVNNRLEWISKYLNNFSLLEKPIRLATLITVVRSALHSRKKQFEQRRILLELAQSKKDAEKASRAKTSFLANMSHEIRTPLSVIVGFLDLLKTGATDKKDFQKYVNIIARNGEQLANLINDVLDLSKIEAGKIEVQDKVIFVSEFLTDLSKILRPLVEKENLKFEFEVASNLPQAIISDEGKIRQILINLVGNATKFTESGTVKIAVNANFNNANQVKISFDVIDTGIGIEQSKQVKIFFPFSQADDSVTREYGGSGLGLSLSKKLAESLGGKICLINSEVGKGSHFQVFFNVTVASESTKQVEIEQELEGALKGVEILLAEDSMDNRYLISKYLEDASAKVDAVSNGEEAYKLAMTKKYDLIIMDIQMPVMDGLTATKKLRSENYDGTIVALTAHALKDDKDKSLKAGFNKHFTKPVVGHYLIRTVKALCTG